MVVIGASAGGLTALATLLGAIPVGFPAPVALVLHLSPDRPSAADRRPRALHEAAGAWADDGHRLMPGTVHVAPPDRHLAFQADGRIVVAPTPPVHFSRPSVDLLFDVRRRVRSGHARSR